MAPFRKLWLPVGALSIASAGIWGAMAYASKTSPQPLGPPKTPFGYGQMDSLWPHADNQPAYIPVCWESPKQGQEKYRELVRQTIGATWSEAAPVEFVSWVACTPGRAGIHIAVADGAASEVLGRRLDGMPSGLKIAFDFDPGSWCARDEDTRIACIRALAVHEFGHALGLAHEQNRPDTPRSIGTRFNAPGECNEPPQGPNGSRCLTPWDPESVMNYCHPLYRPGGWLLSEGDKMSIQLMYGSRPDSVVGGPSTSASNDKSPCTT